jgi:hypothetical protein
MHRAGRFGAQHISRKSAKPNKCECANGNFIFRSAAAPPPANHLRRSAPRAISPARGSKLRSIPALLKIRNVC